MHGVHNMDTDGNSQEGNLEILEAGRIGGGLTREENNHGFGLGMI